MSAAYDNIVNLDERERSHFYGKYRGSVTDVDDPKKMGRIKAKVPFVYGDEHTSNWCMPVVPLAGSGHGLYLMPEVGDAVWIEFENGDIDLPLWTGGWWGDRDLPDPKDPKQRVLTSSTGMQVVLDDDAKELSLKHPGGAEITLSNSNITIKLGSAKIELSSSVVSVNDGALEVR